MEKKITHFYYWSLYPEEHKMCEEPLVYGFTKKRVRHLPFKIEEVKPSTKSAMDWTLVLQPRL